MPWNPERYMSHKGNEKYNEQKRESALEELYDFVRKNYDGDSLKEITDSVYNKFYKNHSFITYKDVGEAVDEYHTKLVNMTR